MKEEIKQLRQLIKELKLTWLDEELDEIISTGKLIEKEKIKGEKKSVQGIQQVPYNDAEELEIIITTLRNYFVTLPKIQSEITFDLSPNLQTSKMSFMEYDGSEFKKIDTNTEKLGKLLSQIKN